MCKNVNSGCFPTYEGIDLLPCPFCGAPGEIDMDEPSPAYATRGARTTYLACCSKCSGMIEEWWETPEEAAEAWNGRTNK